MICTVLDLLPRGQLPAMLVELSHSLWFGGGWALQAGPCELHLCPGIKLLALGS